jgi:hypothetical protein
MRWFSESALVVTRWRVLWALVCAVQGLGGVSLGRAESFFINEIFFNPPAADAPNEWIELRGVPNSAFPEGSYLLGLEGDAANNPGSVQDIFDLSGRRVGGNGLLVLLQNGHGYSVHSAAARIEQTGPEPGWGHGGDSTVRHRGEGSQTDIENASLTFLLLQTDTEILIGDDLDADDDGVLDGEALKQAVIYDSVGILDVDGLGDIAYGLLNFRRSGLPGSRATAGGTVVSLGFTPTWIARLNNSTSFKATDWAASEINSSSPPFSLGEASRTYPAALANAQLNHIGASNFGAPTAPGVVVLVPPDLSPLAEAGGTSQYRVALSVTPTGEVDLEIQADPGLELSIDRGATYGILRSLRLTTTEPHAIWVRAVENLEVDVSVRGLSLRHRVTQARDGRFTNALVPAVEFEVQENDFLLLNEVVVDPLGADQEQEFVELRGAPGAVLRNIYLVVVESDAARNLGTARRVLPLTGAQMGTNGLLWITSAQDPVPADPATGIFPLPRSGEATGGSFPNGSFSLLLLAAGGEVDEDDDWDNGDNGVLEGLPKRSSILDSLAWRGEVPGDLAYGVLLADLVSNPPDAATRFYGNNQPNEAAAWYFGDLRSSDPAGLRYDRSLSSTNLPTGGLLTPGAANNTPPLISKIDPICGALGDPTNPSVLFSVSDNESESSQLRVTVSSDAPTVVPADGLTLEPAPGGEWRLRIQPSGVGYARLTVEVWDGGLLARESFDYAASGRASERTRYLMGAGDGSTVIPLADGWMLVGDDENQMIRLYQRDRSGLHQSRFPMTPFLGLLDIEDGIPREVDIEGSTRVGNRLFWMGAHSHANIAEARVNRGRIFATDLVDAGAATSLTYVGRYDHLKEDLVDWDLRNLHGKGPNYYGLAESVAEGVDPKAEDGSGFNLEGLCLAPGSSEAAYIACRAPLVPAHRRTHALVVTVLNFASLAASDAPPGSAQFGPPIELDLFGRGIRSIEGEGTNYLIVAGPAGPAPGRYPQDFRLYRWTGQPGDSPQLLSAFLGGLNPEAIVELPPAPWLPDTEVQILSDSGTRIWYGDTTITKLLPETNFKKCRMDWVTLGSVEVPQPVIVEVSPSPEGSLVRWRGLPGAVYRLQWCDQLETVDWRDVAEDVIAEDVLLEKRHLAPIVGNRYYRVVSPP